MSYGLRLPREISLLVSSYLQPHPCCKEIQFRGSTRAEYHLDDSILICYRSKKKRSILWEGWQDLRKRVIFIPNSGYRIHNPFEPVITIILGLTMILLVNKLHLRLFLAGENFVIGAIVAIPYALVVVFLIVRIFPKFSRKVVRFYKNKRR
jgi:hypothetical protein